MSAFVVALDWQGGADLDVAAGEAALGGFAVYGWKHIRQIGFCASQAKMSSTHARSESEGDVDRQFIVLLDGRLSPQCRLALREGHGSASSAITDDALIASVWPELKERVLPLLDGDFALAVYDCSASTLCLARSRSGARGLYFVRRSGSVTVATRSAAALRAAGVPLVEQPDAIAAYFALRAPTEGSTYFHGVSALLPGRSSLLDPHGCRAGPALASAKLDVRDVTTDEQARAQWQSELSRAVAESMFGWRMPAIMLSGGVDSSTLAAFAVRQRRDVLACSWVLPDTPDSDERSWIDQTTVHLGLQSNRFDGGAHWPLSRLSQWPVEDDGPPSNPYRALLQCLYARAAAAGCDVMLTGNFGDHLYPETGEWLWSGLMDRGAAWALGQELHLLTRQGIRALWNEPGLRSIGRRFLGRGRDVVEWSPPSWMQAKWRSELNDQLGRLMPSRRADTPEAIQDAELGRRFHCMHGIELVAPYRDSRLMNLAAQLPAHCQYRDGINKYLTRSIMKGLLPEPVRLRPKGGSLVPFFRLGLIDKEAAQVESLLNAPDARWSNYVDPYALTRAREKLSTESDLLLVWLCVGYELWWRAHWAKGPAVLASRVKPGDVSEAIRD